MKTQKIISSGLQPDHRICMEMSVCESSRTFKNHCKRLNKSGFFHMKWYGNQP